MSPAPRTLISSETGVCSRRVQIQTNKTPDAGLVPVCRCLGPCLALCPEYSFVLEDELGVCGCVLGVLDVRSFTKRCQASWIPAMSDKYPPKSGKTQVRTQRRRGGTAVPLALNVSLVGPDPADGGGPRGVPGLSPLSLPLSVATGRAARAGGHQRQPRAPHHAPYCTQSQRWVGQRPVADKECKKKVNYAFFLFDPGSQGVFCEVQPTDRQRLEFLTKLGFLEILRGEARSREGVVLGRLL